MNSTYRCRATLSLGNPIIPLCHVILSDERIEGQIGIARWSHHRQRNRPIRTCCVVILNPSTSRPSVWMWWNSWISKCFWVVNKSTRRTSREDFKIYIDQIASVFFSASIGFPSFCYHSLSRQLVMNAIILLRITYSRNISKKYEVITCPRLK